MTGSIYSWSLTNIKGIAENKHALGFPLNQYFAFIVLSLVSMINGIIVATLPNQLNEPVTTHDADITPVC